MARKIKAFIKNTRTPCALSNFIYPPGVGGKDKAEKMFKDIINKELFNAFAICTALNRYPDMLYRFVPYSQNSKDISIIGRDYNGNEVIVQIQEQ